MRREVLVHRSEISPELLFGFRIVRNDANVAARSDDSVCKPRRFEIGRESLPAAFDHDILSRQVFMQMVLNVVKDKPRQFVLVECIANVDKVFNEQRWISRSCQRSRHHLMSGAKLMSKSESSDETETAARSVAALIFSIACSVVDFFRLP
jgi:hypothetical protein